MAKRVPRGPRTVPPPPGVERFACRIDVLAPRQLVDDMALARSLTGEGVADFVRRAVRRLADREVFRRPGVILWARPRARVWRLEGVGAEVVATPLAECAGGERVFPLSRVDRVPQACAPEGERGDWTSGLLCDVAPDPVRSQAAGLSLRRVLILSGDVLPVHPGRVGGYARRAVVLADAGENAAPKAVTLAKADPSILMDL